MTLVLRERDVLQILTMPMALEAVESAFWRLAGGRAVLHPRRRLHVPGMSYLHYMAAGDPVSGVMGMKMYTSAREGLRFLVPLFNAQNGELLALLEADYLGQMRTGAASGIATRHMARADARRVGILGTGLQARTQLEAIAAVRPLESVRAFSRNPEHRRAFAREMTARLGVPVTAAESAENAVRGADIVVTATTSSQPVFDGAWLEPGTHVNAIGANFSHKRELDENAIRRTAIIAVDSVEQSREEAGDLIQTFSHDATRWDQVVELAEIVAGRRPGRTSPAEITLFKSSGIAMEDVITAERVYRAALNRGIGEKLNLWDEKADRPEAR